jgi:menaquinone-dependent protoporphyrinogen IX oxidase
MRTYDDIQDDVGKVFAELLEYKDLLSKAILKLPDNPRITRISKGSTSAFVISSSALLGGKNWCVRHQDFRAQYQEIAEYLIRMPAALFSIKTFMKEIEDSKRRKKYRTQFHPDVIEAVKEVIKKEEFYGH